MVAFDAGEDGPQDHPRYCRSSARRAHQCPSAGLVRPAAERRTEDSACEVGNHVRGRQARSCLVVEGVDGGLVGDLHSLDTEIEHQQRDDQHDHLMRSPVEQRPTDKFDGPDAVLGVA
ncbi:Uncharacterised protein [Mycobacteroides abscessus subsp. abscessus]|nr:Uncharacterised protein [Mycobacteroides abscessus subsp. abscessus]